jgi:hypothetical protein
MVWDLVRGRSSPAAGVGVAVGVPDDFEVEVAVGVLDKFATMTVDDADPRFTLPTP